MNNLKLALVQFNPEWENPNKNMELLEILIQDLKKVDLIVLPEMFNTGFSMNGNKIGEKMDGQTVLWLKKMSNQLESAICGSLVINEGNKLFNRLVFITPDGEIHHYDKRHLFRLAKEHHVYTPGKTRKIVNYKSWRINLNVCYDLRFPAWSRNKDDYDILLNVASWPETRIHHWDTLLAARAIENLSYVLAVNRVGVDHNNLTYTGHSCAIDFSGKILQKTVNTSEVVEVELSKSKLLKYKEKFAFHLDRDEFIIN